MHFKNEFFEPDFTKSIEKGLLEILLRSSEHKGALTPILGFEIESYCQESETFNGMKGVSRVVLVNERGERVLDTYIQLVNEACSNRKA